MPGPDGRLEAFLLSAAIGCAVAVILSGPFRTYDRLRFLEPDACERITELHTNTITQAMALAAALIALRKYTRGGPPPPS